MCFIRIAFRVAIRISGLEISFQELAEVIFYKSDIGRILTEIICVCGVVNFGSMNGCYVSSIRFQMTWQVKYPFHLVCIKI